MFLDHAHQPVPTEFLPPAVHALEKSVGEKQEQIAFLDRALEDLVGAVFKEPERGVVVEVRRQLDHPVLRAVEEERGGVSGRRVGGRHGPDIEDEIKRGDEDHVAGVVHDFVEVVVQELENFRRIAGNPLRVLQQGCDDGGDQRGAGPVAHHVGDKNAGLGIPQFQHVEKVSPDRARRAVDVVEIEPERRPLARRGDLGIIPRHQIGLKLFGEIQVAADLPGLLGDLRFQFLVVAEDPLPHEGKFAGEILDFIAGPDVVHIPKEVRRLPRGQALTGRCGRALA